MGAIHFFKDTTVSPWGFQENRNRTKPWIQATKESAGNREHTYMSKAIVKVQQRRRTGEKDKKVIFAQDM